MSNKLKLLRERATRPRRTVAVLLDGEVREQIEAVEDELDRLDPSAKPDRRLNSKSDTARRKELEAELVRLREAAQDATLILVVEALPKTAFRALLAQHPPRKGEDGKVLPVDTVLGANVETLALPLARASVVGYRETDDAASPVLPVDPETLTWLFGSTAVGPLASDIEPFCTERQIGRIGAAAVTLNIGDDAVPLPRRRSATQTSDAE